jgi:hypothetical protein
VELCPSVTAAREPIGEGFPAANLGGAPVRIIDRVPHLFSAEVQTREVPRVRFISEPAVNRIGASLDRGTERGGSSSQTN